MQAKELFARGDAPGFQFDEEAARISGWPRESDADTDRPVRAVLQAVYRQETTPEQALKIMDGLGLP